MGFDELLFGSDAGTQARKDLFNKFTNYDNRMNDFNTFSGQALNSLANRGIVNSSVTSGAMADALNQANTNYYNQLSQASAFMPQDSMGLIPSLIGSGASALGQSLPLLFLL